MSVLLTACQRSRQKSIEKALKKKAERQRQKRQAALADVVEQLCVPEDTSSTKVWTFLLNGIPNSVVFHLDTLDVSHNGYNLETENEFTEDGSKVIFFLGTHVAQIVTEACAGGRKGLVYSLTVDGNIVPE